MISNEIKYRAIVHYTHFLRSLRKVAKIYSVSKSTLQRWVSSSPRDIQRTKPKRRRNQSNVRDSIKQKLRQLILSNPFITLKTLRHEFFNLSVNRSERTLGRYRTECGFVRKKALRVVDASSRLNEIQTREFCSSHVQSSSNGQIVCIDEAGLTIGDHKRYGYAARGRRLNVLAGRTLRRSKLTLILAISEDGIVDFKIQDQNCGKQDFIKFVTALNVPEGTTFLMDNVSFHRSCETINAIEAKGCTALFTPPYSPKFNAIENVFGLLKSRFRSRCPVSISETFDYRSLMDAILFESRDSDFTSFFRRSASFSQEILNGKPFLNYES